MNFYGRYEMTVRAPLCPVQHKAMDFSVVKAWPLAEVRQHLAVIFDELVWLHSRANAKSKRTPQAVRV
ncbi:hypothetical protein GCM10007320_10640 [Pseudorhodoferax aquiterrae]|uniref:Uncharacterized protein n=1 Tax=Pseudorhodoferax aquiterrae TaxID=747304 RepID=A0ABQ3FY96_9BURK|nr:hypothetical protein GCM10007320_10640 [Pseudorhodoferax aquiterrae]